LSVSAGKTSKNHARRIGELFRQRGFVRCCEHRGDSRVGFSAAVDAIDIAGEITIARKDGSRVRAALSLSSVEAGGQSRTIAFVRDITLEVGRRDRMALLTLVADRTNRAVVVTDRNLKVVYTNAAFTGMFGYSVEEAMGRQANELLVGRHTDRRTLARLRRWIDDEAGGGMRHPALAWQRA